jgi:hypothetical protein
MLSLTYYTPTKMIATEFKKELDKYASQVDMLSLYYDEMLSQAQAEAAMFGDSWSGSRQNLDKAKKAEEDARKRFDVLSDIIAPLYDKYLERGDVEGAEICVKLIKGRPFSTMREVIALRFFENLI